MHEGALLVIATSKVVLSRNPDMVPEGMPELRVRSIAQQIVQTGG